MDHHTSRSVFVRRTAGIAAVAVVALLIGLSVAPTVTPSATDTQATPSYDSLQALLRQGQGKGLDRGVIDVWASTSPTPLIPTAWVWVEDDTVDGEGVEYWAFHPDFVHPNADEDVALTYGYRDDVDVASVEEFIDWVVETNDHVKDASDLTVVMNSVVPVPVIVK